VVIAPALNAETSAYPLRGMPLAVAEDFDAPLDHLWQALEDDNLTSRAAEEPAVYGKK